MLEKANNIITNFVNNLGLDGEYYVSVNKSPIMWGNCLGDGRFYNARSEDLLYFLKNIEMDVEKKKAIYNSGLIVINKKFKSDIHNPEATLTIVHETFHSNRMLLLNKQDTIEDINPVIFHNGRYIQTTDGGKSYYADASQDIFKGSIDDSKKAISEFASLTEDDLATLSFKDERYNAKMSEQQTIDEALVETMSLVAYKSYVDKNPHIMQIVQLVNQFTKQEDIKAMTNIILRHNDLELFKWMIDPLQYQLDDVNYDFFAHYITDDDKEDMECIRKFSFVDDDYMDEVAKSL